MSAHSARAAAPALLGVERSAAGRRWESRCGDDRLALALAQALDLPEVLGRVLAGRGVTPDRAERWLAPTLRDMLPDPSRLADMDRAAERLARALEGGETVGVFGDYDVDGATASALVRLYVEAVGGRARPYIPDRRREGYGPNRAALERLAGEGVRVVVTVDCGTTALEPLAAAAALGLDVIVVDHHQAGPERPRCHALVNPNRLDDTSGLGALAAVGVAFLLIVAVNRALRARGRFAAGGEPDLLSLLDLVALGTVCDMVPLTGLNRAFVRQGLKVMARRANPGLAALADTCRLDSAPGTYHAGFLLGPRINAGGRVGEADLGHRLLCARSVDEARPLAERLDRYNTERRAIEDRVLAAAHARAEAAMAAAPAALVVAPGDDDAEDWHPGVVGLVASRLAERYHRPAVVISRDGAVAKGSARSVPGFDIGAAVTAARQSGLLAAAGGHPMAAGVTLAADRIEAFTRFLCGRAAAGGIAAARPPLGLDGTLAPGGATTALVDRLETAGPYGVGNPEPRFAVPECRIAFADTVGGGHVRCRLAGSDGRTLQGIAFRAADGPVGAALLAARGGALHVAGHLRRDRWRGRDGVQMAVDDVAPPR